MTSSRAGVISLAEAAREPITEVGQKVANLAAVRSDHIEVPDGFIILAWTLDQMTEAAGISDRLDRLWSAAFDADPAEIARIAREARRIIHGAPLGADLRREIIEHYHHLGTDAAVAVRASATSIAGEQPQCAGVLAAHLDVVGDDVVIAAARSCWASLFGERSLTMSAQRLGGERPSVAVFVQRMIPAERSGLLAPVDSTGELTIEATFGLSEPILSGVVEPDRYVCDREMELVRSVDIGSKEIELAAGPDGAGHAFSSAARRESAVLDQQQLAALCRLSSSIDHELGGPHEVEWASVGDRDYVVQIRPITSGFSDRSGAHFGVPGVLSGIGVGAGTAEGRVRILTEPPSLVSGPTSTDLGSDDVLVVSSSHPTWSPSIGRVAAVVTDFGDAHSHAALVCRQLGIPAVVGTQTATIDLSDGMLVTVDADRGWVIAHHSPKNVPTVSPRPPDPT